MDVIEERWIKPRCTAHHHHEEYGTVQCDDWDEHFGSHRHAVSVDEVLFWPSQDDVEDAKATAEIEAMSDDQIMATLVNEDQGITRETVNDWAKGAAVFAKAMIQASKRITALEQGCRDALRHLREHDNEYHHRTPPALLRELEQLVPKKEK